MNLQNSRQVHEAEIGRYFAIVKKWWWLMLASTLLAGVSGYLAVSRMPRIYQATTTVVVGQSLEKTSPTYTDISISQQLAQTYLNMATRRPILEGAADALGLQYVPWAGNISARIVPGTQFLEISVLDSDPERARALADAIAQQLIEQTPEELSQDSDRRTFIQTQLQNLEENIQATEEEIKAEQAKLDAANSARAIQQYQTNIAALQQKLASYQSSYASLLQTVQGGTNYIAVFEPALTPQQPISPQVRQTVLLAAAVGLVLAVGGALLIEFLDDTVKEPDDLQRTADLSTLGSIARMNGKENSDMLVAIQQPLSPVTEAYRVLRTNIQVSSVDKPVRSLVVTSAKPFEGKSTTVANLGVAVAQTGKTVVLVDSDLRRSTLHKLFDVPNKEGLTTALLQEQPGVDGLLCDTAVENLRVLTSGPLPPNPAELLGSQKMRQLIDALEKEADLIIFDSPPALAVTDAAVLAMQTDGVLVVAEAGRTRRAAIRQVAENLRQVGANVLGAVLNLMSPRDTALYGYYYGAKSKGRLGHRKKE
jgi:capsular exopolysaccharide synthesis family protein